MQVNEVAMPLLNDHLLIDDTPTLMHDELRSRVQDLKRNANIGLVVVDSFEMFNSAELTKDSCATLKAIAQEIQAPVIATSTLIRALEQREDKRPVLADLRPGVSVDDCDVILLMYREELYTPGSAQGVAEIIVGKQPHGPLGSVRLGFQDTMNRFTALKI